MAPTPLNTLLLPVGDRVRKNFMTKSASLVGVLSFSLAVVSCGGSDDTPDPELSAGKACGGLSSAAASALRGITETDEFKYRHDSAVAALIKKSLNNASREERNELLQCEILPQQPEGSDGVSKITVLFETVPLLPPSENDLLGQVEYPIALRATANDGNAQIYFSCDISGGISQQKTVPIVRGELIYGPRARKKDPRPGNIKVLQDISYKIAKGMGCANNGDIPKL